jgi:GTPase-activating protein SST2
MNMLFELSWLILFFGQDSVPKFVRDPRYNQVLREHEFEDVITERGYSPTPTAPERSTSRSTKLS